MYVRNYDFVKYKLGKWILSYPSISKMYHKLFCYYFLSYYQIYLKNYVHPAARLSKILHILIPNSPTSPLPHNNCFCKETIDWHGIPCGDFGSYSGYWVYLSAWLAQALDWARFDGSSSVLIVFLLSISLACCHKMR